MRTPVLFRNLQKLAVAALLCSSLSAHADPYQWTGSGSDKSWITGANWSTNVSPNAFNADVIFAESGANLTTFLGTNSRTIASLTFASASSRNVNIVLANTATGTGNRDLYFGPGTSSTAVHITVESGASGNFVIGSTAYGSVAISGNSLTVNHQGSGLLTIGREIRGTGSLVKTGGGTLLLSGVNTYTGSTSINAGTLRLTGSLQSSSVSINGTGILESGAGQISGSLLINGATLKLQNSAIQTTTSGSLTMAAGALLTMEYNSTLLTSDLLNIQGDLNIALDNSSQLALTNLGSSSFNLGHVIELIRYSGNWNGGLLNINGTLVSDGGSVWIESTQFQANYSSGSLSLTAIPEPSSVALLAFTGFGALYSAKRFRRQS